MKKFFAFLFLPLGVIEIIYASQYHITVTPIDAMGNSMDRVVDLSLLQRNSFILFFLAHHLFQESFVFALIKKKEEYKISIS